MAESDEWEPVDVRPAANAEEIPADPYDPRRWGVETIEGDGSNEEAEE